MTVCVGDNEVIGCGIAVGKRLEAEGTAEDAFMHIVGGLVGNNRSGIAHCLSVAVGEIRMTDGCLANASDRFFLIEIQREYHVADLPACRQKMNRYRLGVVLASIALVFSAVVAQEVVFDDRNHHLLQTDAAVNKIQPAAFHLDADALSRRKAFVFGVAVKEFYRKKILRLCAFLHNCVTSADLYILIALGGFVNLFVLFQRTVGI